MTVGELIKALEPYDQDAQVFFEYEGNHYPLKDLYLETDDQHPPGSAENRTVGP
jgi:hypothetical protein